MAIANTTLILRKSGTPGVAPSALANGEIALNYADGRLYYKNASGAITYIANGSSSSGGSSSNSFATINANSSLILATSSTDTLSIVPGNNITITSISGSSTPFTITSNNSGLTSMSWYTPYTNYYVAAVNGNNIQVAATYANAILSTPVVISLTTGVNVIKIF